MPRVIRKLDIAGRPAFDEQLWPINALLIVLSALAAGVIVGTSDFTEEVSWRNGWVRLVTLIVSVGLLMGLAWWFRGRIGRRFQLGAAASLLIHALVGVLLYFQQLDLLDIVPSVARRDAEPVLVQYEYLLRSPDEQTPREAHERPIDTPTPENRPIEPTRTPTAEPRIDEPLPQPLPENETPLEPTQIEMRRNELAAPKRADRESQLSRSITQTPSQPSQQVSAPEQRATADPSPQLEARTNDLARVQTASPAQRRALENPSQAQPSRQAAQLTRNANESVAEPSVSTPASAIARAATAPADAPNSMAAAAPAARAEAEPTAQLTARANEAPRQESSAPMVQRATTSVGQPTPTTPAATAARAASEAEPTVSPAPNAPSLDRALSAPATEGLAASDQPAATVESAPTPSPTGPAPTQAARAAQGAPSRATIEAANAAPPSRAEILQSTIARREQTGDPGVARDAQSAEAPSRAVAATTTAASPQPVESPAAQVTSVPDNTAGQQPAATSIDRSTAGTTGVGQSPNLDRGLPSPANRPEVAAAAAQRAASTIESGAAPAAGTVALRRSQARARIDAATALARDAAAPDYRAASAALELEASTGAAIARSASSAPTGVVAADAGRLPADTGRPQVASVSGQTRSDGGGQPSVAATANPGQPGRTAIAAAAPAASGEVATPASSATTADDVRASQIAAQSGRVSRSEINFAGSGAVASDVSREGRIAQSASVASSAAAARDEGAPAPAAGSAAAPARTLLGADAAPAQAQDAQAASDTPQTATGEVAAPISNQPAARRDQSAPSRAIAAGLGNGAQLAVDVAETGARSAPAASSPRETTLDQPGVSHASANGAPGRSASATGAAASTSAIDVPELGAAHVAAGAEGDIQPGPATGPSAVERRATGGVPVEIASTAGPGGLASELSAVVGSRKTTAQRESHVIHDADTRFLGREISGAVPAASFVREAAKAFERRGRDTGTGEGQPGAKTEEAIERGLEFLARAQQEDGSWSFQKFPGATDDDAGTIQSDTAATGLALMAFLGGGYDHFEDKHRDTVRRGLQYLLRQQDESGDLYVAQDPKSHESAWLYSHAIASIAMTEALGMTGDQELRGPAQRAIEFIEAAQDKQYGGWRYQPGVSSDTSVSGWMLMALKSGELAGLSIKPETYDAVKRWLELSQANRNDGSRYVYNPYAPNTPDKRHGRRPSPAMTSVGLLMRLYLGWDRGRPEFKRGAEHILEYQAAYGTASNPMRDTYYWYYATQVMFHMRGDYWKQWNGKLYPLLTSTQVQQGGLAGSWNPGGNVEDRWGPQGGRIYVTTLNLLSLEVYYRHLPIYEVTAK